MYISGHFLRKLLNSPSKFFTLVDESQKLEQVHHVVFSAAAFPSQLHQVPGQPGFGIRTEFQRRIKVMQEATKRTIGAKARYVA